MSSEPERPTLRVIRGDATAEEIAALLAVVSARTLAGRSRPARKPLSTWADRAALTRRPAAAGPGAWAASGLPR
jgi:hypothetical protein